MDPFPRRRVTRSFQARGMTLQASALEAVMNVLRREEDCVGVLKDIVEACKENSIGNAGIVTTDVLAAVIVDLTRNSKDIMDEAFQILNAYETPRLYYDTMRKQFTLQRNDDKSFFGEASDKIDMMAQRFALVHQRILKQDVFRPKHTTADGRQISSDSRHVTHSLCSIESLIGRKGCRFLLGMLVQVEEGKFYLEDFSAQVPLDIREAEILTDGFLAENCIILVEGEMIDGTLYVHRMGNPIVETRLSAIQDIGLATTDMFQSISSLAQLEDIQQQETLHGSDGMLVVLSNVYLDNPQVMEKLKILFEGFLEMNPVYVFMGNFMSSGTSAKELLGYFEDLTRLICSMDGLAQKGRFIFLPGPRDPGLRGILPQPALPKYCTQSLRNKVTHATFATNPCRLRYFSKEIILYRNDVVFQLQRSALVTPRESGSTVIQHTVKTLLDQGHLAPYPRPIYWQHDHVMRLYPLPDALIIGDSLDQYFENYAECDIINPGRFSHDFSFVVYRPIASIEKTKTKSEVEFSQIGN